MRGRETAHSTAPGVLLRVGSHRVRSLLGASGVLVTRIEPVLLEPDIELTTRDPEALRRARLVEACFLEDAFDRRALDRAEIRVALRTRALGSRGGTGRLDPAGRCGLEDREVLARD